MFSNTICNNWPITNKSAHNLSVSLILVSYKNNVIAHLQSISVCRFSFSHSPFHVVLLTCRQLSV